MRTVKYFETFGRHYRITQFAATRGFELMEKREELGPLDMLSGTSARRDSGEWVDLNTRETINELVTDIAEILPPREILDVIFGFASYHNFGFLHSWKGAKIPRRFVSEKESVSSTYVEPIVSILIQDKVATLKELEEYYSLEDAFKMFDVIVVKGINQALSNEDTMKSARKR